MSNSNNSIHVYPTKTGIFIAALIFIIFVSLVLFDTTVQQLGWFLLPIAILLILIGFEIGVAAYSILFKKPTIVADLGGVALLYPFAPVKYKIPWSDIEKIGKIHSFNGRTVRPQLAIWLQNPSKYELKTKIQPDIIHGKVEIGDVIVPHYAIDSVDILLDKIEVFPVSIFRE